MSQVCILTDSTAQFMDSDFPGFSRIKLIPIKAHIARTTEKTHPRSGLFSEVRFTNSSVDELRQRLQIISQEYNEVIALLTSARLMPELYRNMERAIASLNGRLAAQVIDSQTTSVGLGYLAEIASQAVQAGATSNEINRLIQSQIAHIYTIFCTRNIAYLAQSGNLDPTHAAVGEMLGLAPVWLLENGQFVAYHKARNARHLVDILDEFVQEFYGLGHVAILKGIAPFNTEAAQLRERFLNHNYRIEISEHQLSNPLTQILGSRSLGLVVIEK